MGFFTFVEPRQDSYPGTIARVELAITIPTLEGSTTRGLFGITCALLLLHMIVNGRFYQNQTIRFEWEYGEDSHLTRYACFRMAEWLFSYSFRSYMTMREARFPLACHAVSYASVTSSLATGVKPTRSLSLFSLNRSTGIIVFPA